MIKICPRGKRYTSSINNDKGMTWKSIYGAIGITSDTTAFINEGINEKGLVAGMFFFDHYATYHDYDPKAKDHTIDALDLSYFILSNCSTTDEVKEKLAAIRICGSIRSELGRVVPLHWRVGDAHGKSIIIECVDKQLNIYDDTLGVITNSPPYPYHITNLCNYVTYPQHPSQKPKWEI
jgi:choloylglycine hydrolase